jgi:hypothetical protein
MDTRTHEWKIALTVGQFVAVAAVVMPNKDDSGNAGGHNKTAATVN